MLDRYWLGTADRLSPEAPVPVIKIKAVVSAPGGAANVAANLEALGEQVRTVWGGGLPVKNRLMVGDCQLARWDENDWCSAPGSQALEEGLAGAGAVVVSDYRKGTIGPGQIAQILQAKLPLFVDTKDNPADWLGAATVVFPNDKEYAEYQWVYDRFGLVVLKRGSKGMELLSRGERWASAPARATTVRSVNGAGDTVLAGFVSEYLRQGSEPSKANRALGFASMAAAVAVEKPYTAVAERAVVEERFGRRVAA